MKNTSQYPYENLVTSVLMNDHYQYAYETDLKSVPMKTKKESFHENLVISVLMNDCYQYHYENAVANRTYE